jgi:hypothetical protein
MEPLKALIIKIPFVDVVLQYLIPIRAYLPVFDILDVGLVCVLLALLWYAVFAVRVAVRDKKNDDDEVKK